MHSCSVPSIPKGNTEQIVSTTVARLKRQARLQLEQSGIPRKALAEDLYTDETRLCRWLNDDYRDRFPADLLSAWTRELGPGLLSWIARDCGYDLVATDPRKFHPANDDPVQLVALIARHSGITISETIEAISSGGMWTAEEKRHALSAFTRLQFLVNELVEELQREEEVAS